MGSIVLRRPSESPPPHCVAPLNSHSFCRLCAKNNNDDVINAAAISKRSAERLHHHSQNQRSRQRHSSIKFDARITSSPRTCKAREDQQQQQQNQNCAITPAAAPPSRMLANSKSSSLLVKIAQERRHKYEMTDCAITDRSARNCAITNRSGVVSSKSLHFQSSQTNSNAKTHSKGIAKEPPHRHRPAQHNDDAILPGGAPPLPAVAAHPAHPPPTTATSMNTHRKSSRPIGRGGGGGGGGGVARVRPPKKSTSCHSYITVAQQHWHNQQHRPHHPHHPHRQPKLMMTSLEKCSSAAPPAMCYASATTLNLLECLGNFVCHAFHSAGGLCDARHCRHDKHEQCHDERRENNACVTQWPASAVVLEPSRTVSWIRQVDQNLMLQGWSEISFISPANLVFLFMLIRNLLELFESAAASPACCSAACCVLRNPPEPEQNRHETVTSNKNNNDNNSLTARQFQASQDYDYNNNNENSKRADADVNGDDDGDVIIKMASSEDSASASEEGRTIGETTGERRGGEQGGGAARRSIKKILHNAIAKSSTNSQEVSHLNNTQQQHHHHHQNNSNKHHHHQNNENQCNHLNETRFFTQRHRSHSTLSCHAEEHRCVLLHAGRHTQAALKTAGGGGGGGGKRRINRVHLFQHIVMTCLYTAYSYQGNEISYPLRPFLIDDDSESRHYFWSICEVLWRRLSNNMLSINSDTRVFTRYFHELQSFSKKYS